MRLKLTALALIAALMGAFVFAPMSASAQQQTANASFNTAGPLTGGGTFEGTVSNLQFFNQGGSLAVSGVLNGVLKDAQGNVIQELTDFAFNAIVDTTQTNGTCEILNLVIGPIHLDVLGLVVDISQITINITAESGPGNLLGNLLCAVAHLLDDPDDPTNALANLLNRILRLLG